MKCFLKEIKYEKILDPLYGDLKLQVYPCDFSKMPIILPAGFELWQSQINKIAKLIPYQKDANLHYITIDSKFFTEESSLRREGAHIDGNFCVDPTFLLSSWGGTTWSGTSIENGKITQKFVSPYNIQIPIGEYVSENKGGIICASSYSGCIAWSGELVNIVGDGGSYDEKYLQGAKEHNLEKNIIYFLTSNAPHKSLLIPKGTRRTLIRITLNHNYNNNVFVNNFEMAA